MERGRLARGGHDGGGLGQPAPHELARFATLAHDRGRCRGQGGYSCRTPRATRTSRAAGFDLFRHAVNALGFEQQRHPTWDASLPPPNAPHPLRL